MEIHLSLAEKIPEKKTATFKNYILGFYGSNMNHSQALPHAFYRDDLELLFMFGGVRPYLQMSFLSFIRNNLR